MNVYIIHVSILNGISEINQLFDDILIIWPAPVYILNKIVYRSLQYEVMVMDEWHKNGP